MQNLARVCLLIAALIVVAPSVTTGQPLMSGVKIGIDISSLPNAGEVFDQVVKQPSTETSAKFGVTFGGFVILPITGQFSLQPELMFVGKGVKLKEATNNGTVTASLRYLEFPLLLRYATTVGNYPAFLLVGPTLGIKASTGAHLDGPNGTVDYDIDSAVRNFDGGIAFGGGIDYHHYVFEVRYTLGLSDIASDVFPHTDALKNRVFAVLAGYRFK